MIQPSKTAAQQRADQSSGFQQLVQDQVFVLFKNQHVLDDLGVLPPFYTLSLQRQNAL